MTQHVRTSYGNHRQATWGAVLAVLVLALAAVPFATGAGSPPKFYSLQASPTNACSTPSTQTFTLTLKNESRNAPIGSANITAPSYVSLITGSGTSSTGGITVNVPDGFSSTPNTIRLRNLVLPNIGNFATITVQANVAEGAGQTWTSTVKQSNSFSDSGPGNLVTLSGSPPSATVSACHYEFVAGPVNAVKNVAQTVKVQLQTSTGAKVDGSGELPLTAYQGIDSNAQLASDIFTGLTSTAANGEWSFNVVGTASGESYSLKAGTNRSAYFQIADCVPTDGTCNVGFVPNGDGTGGAAFNGSGLQSSGIALSFESIPDQGRDICNGGWGWEPLEFPVQPDGTKNFDGITLSTFSYNTSNGFMKVKFYFRLDLFVQTSASQTNDIQICAGARHSLSANATTDGSTERAWMGRNGILAKWDTATDLYWGVVGRVPNCNKLPSLDPKDDILDPALCAWGTETVNGVDYRTGTVVFPVDLDLKGGG